jgi:hypothetical protein
MRSVDHTVYSDFVRAECHGLNEQMAALGVSGSVHWRGVQVEPSLPVPMRSSIAGRSTIRTPWKRSKAGSSTGPPSGWAVCRA